MKSSTPACAGRFSRSRSEASRLTGRASSGRAAQAGSPTIAARCTTACIPSSASRTAAPSRMSPRRHSNPGWPRPRAASRPRGPTIERPGPGALLEEHRHPASSPRSRRRPSPERPYQTFVTSASTWARVEVRGPSPISNQYSTTGKLTTVRCSSRRRVIRSVMSKRSSGGMQLSTDGSRR